MKKLDFADCIHIFFNKYLPLQKGLSKNTISSYSYSIMLFYKYCRAVKNIRPDKLTFAKINRSLVVDFCLWLETERKNSVTSRNLRLAALHSLFLFIQTEVVEQTALCRDILEIKEKRTATIPPTYLTVEETELLLKMPDIHSKQGRRDLTLLLLLYDSGARAQELIDLSAGDIIFGRETTVKLSGKGKKDRIVPITPETASILKGYMKEHNLHQYDQPLFVNRSNTRLTNMGITYILKKYGTSAYRSNPDKFRNSISPHLMRRTKGSHLIQAGVNIYYVRDFLGHASVLTTERYCRNNPEVIRKAIENASNLVIPDTGYYNAKEKNDMMDFLKSLQ